MGVRRLRLGVAVATCALITMCGCTTSDGTKPSELPSVSNSGSASTSATPKLTAEQEAIVSQYKAYFEKSMVLVGASQLEVYEVLTQYAYPKVVDVAFAGLQTLATKSQTSGGAIEFGELEPSVSGTTASMIECRDMSSETVVSATDGSEIWRGGPGVQFVSKFERIPDGSWRISAVSGEENAC